MVEGQHWSRAPDNFRIGLHAGWSWEYLSFMPGRVALPWWAFGGGLVRMWL